MTAIDAICAPHKLKPITRERIERAQLALAGIISRRDNETARRLKPLWDRFEAELASFDEVESLRAKAERLLASRT